jgi:hypothetical protein
MTSFIPPSAVSDASISFFAATISSSRFWSSSVKLPVLLFLQQRLDFRVIIVQLLAVFLKLARVEALALHDLRALVKFLADRGGIRLEVVDELLDDLVRFLLSPSDHSADSFVSQSAAPSRPFRPSA